MAELHRRRWDPAVESYLDDALAAPQRRRVAQHLARCPGCRSHARLIRAIKASLRRRERRLPALSAARLRRHAGRLGGR